MAEPPSPSTSEGGGNTDQRNRFLQFWTTLPGILTGLAAVLTAIVAVVGLLRSGGGTATVESRPTSTVASTSSTTNGGTQPEGVLTQGRLAMMDGDFADLEKSRIEVSHNADLAFESSQLLAESPGFLTAARATSDKAGCVHDLTARHDSFISASER